MEPLAYIPSPSQGVWHLGPLPVRAYALMIIIGIVVAVWLGERRWTARGGAPNAVVDIAVWAVPFGLVGGRLYHVITDYQRYFGSGKHPADALKIWEGGLGIWGAIALGALGAWIGCRRRGIALPAFADALAPGIALAQAIGRWGNWWNQELYGRPLDTWWAVTIDAVHRPRDPKYADIATYHPTFLYESLWCLGVAVLVIWAGRRFRLTHGRTFALYVAAYTVGRFWIESLRIDDAHHILGLRLNDWTSLIVFLAAVAYLWLNRDRGDEESLTVGTATAGPATGPSAGPAPAESAAAVPGETADGAAPEVTDPGEDTEDTEDAGNAGNAGAIEEIEETEPRVPAESGPAGPGEEAGSAGTAEETQQITPAPVEVAPEPAGPTAGPVEPTQSAESAESADAAGAADAAETPEPAESGRPAADDAPETEQAEDAEADVEAEADSAPVAVDEDGAESAGDAGKEPARKENA